MFCAVSVTTSFVVTNNIFAARCYVYARPMPSCGVHLSARVSVTFVYSVETSTHISKMFSLSGRHTILGFPYQTLWQYFEGTPQLGQKSRFSTNVWLCDRWLFHRRVALKPRRLFMAQTVTRRSAKDQWMLFTTVILDFVHISRRMGRR